MRLRTGTRMRVVAIVLLLLILVVAFGIYRFFSAGGGSTVYRLSGTAASVSLTYESASGTSEQLDNVALPWQLSRAAKSGDLLYVSAVNKGETGTVTCEVVDNGRVINQNTVDGAFAVATCTTTQP